MLLKISTALRAGRIAPRPRGRGCSLLDTRGVLFCVRNRFRSAHSRGSSADTWARARAPCARAPPRAATMSRRAPRTWTTSSAARRTPSTTWARRCGSIPRRSSARACARGRGVAARAATTSRDAPRIIGDLEAGLGDVPSRINGGGDRHTTNSSLSSAAASMSARGSPRRRQEHAAVAHGKAAGQPRELPWGAEGMRRHFDALEALERRQQGSRSRHGNAAHRRERRVHRV